MRLTSDPKPIKIRIVSGGEEHPSLDSLLHCFCLPDLQKVDKQLLQWLTRQGEQGYKIVDELSKVPNWVNATTIDDYFKIYSLFFPKLIEENDIHSLYQLLAFWYGKIEYNRNAHFIIKLALGKDDDVTLFCYNHKIEGLTNNWLGLLNKINKPDINKEVRNLLVLERKKFYPIDTNMLWQQWIYYLWVNQQPHKTHLFDNNDVLARKRESDLISFVCYCKAVYKGYYFDYSIAIRTLFPNINDEDFNSVDRFYDLLGSDYLFCAKVFIILLGDIWEKWNHLKAWKRELVKIYLPAAYMVNEKVCYELDDIGFKEAHFHEQVRVFVCNFLFEF